LIRISSHEFAIGLICFLAGSVLGFALLVS
jgi:hypothetical protein